MTRPSKQQNKASDAKTFLATAITEGQLDAEIAKLAALPPSVYEASRLTEAKRLHMRVTVLDEGVEQHRRRLAKSERQATKSDADQLTRSADHIIKHANILH
jgi:hypothetical protein